MAAVAERLELEGELALKSTEGPGVGVTVGADAASTLTRFAAWHASGAASVADESPKLGRLLLCCRTGVDKDEAVKEVAAVLPGKCRDLETGIEDASL